jgi:hypothetical protein
LRITGLHPLCAAQDQGETIPESKLLIDVTNRKRRPCTNSSRTQVPWAC